MNLFLIKLKSSPPAKGASLRRKKTAMNEVEIPRYIDSQPQFFMWELDEFCVAIGLFGTGIATETMWPMIVLIILISGVLKKFKKENLEGALLHIAFWSGITAMNKENLDAYESELIA